MSICSLYFPPMGRPHIQAPRKKDYLNDVFYQKQRKDWMGVISISNVGLQYLLDIRDDVLSKRSNKMSGCRKLGVVTILSLTAAIGYTVVNIAETWIRLVAGIVGITIAGPLYLIASCFSDFPEDNPIIEFLELTCAISVVIGFVGGLQGVCQIGAGFFAAYKMATDTNRRSLSVTKLVSIASFEIPTTIFKSLFNPS